MMPLPLLAFDCFVLQSGKPECKRIYEENIKGAVGEPYQWHDAIRGCKMNEY